MSSSSPAPAYTEVREECIVYGWSIKTRDFESINVDGKIESSWFYSKNKSEKWWLEFYSFGQPNNSWGRIAALYLARDSPGKSRIKVYVKMTISRSDEILAKRSYPHEYGPHDGHGYHSFLEQSKLFPSVFNDEITIRCIIEIPMDCITPSCGATILDSKRSQLSNDFRLLLEDPKFSDFTVIVEDEKFAVHEVILASRCPFFAAMFEDKDMEENRQNEVKIKNIEPDVMKGMLEFIYTDQVNNIEELASGLLEAADKYDLEELRIMCEETLYEGLNKENVAEVLQLADLHHVDTLKKYVMKYIVDHVPDVKSNNWKNAEWNPKLLLEIVDHLVLPQAANNGTSQSSKA